jgi:lipopolysaccharide biosynthesis protein
MQTLTLFVHHDPSGHIKRHVLEYIRELQRVSDEVVVLSSTASEQSQSRLTQEGVSIWKTDNTGYDIGKWRSYLSHHPITDVQRLILANDSCLLFRPLAPVMEVMGPHSDVWGLSMSHEKAKHLQSYFLVFQSAQSRAALVSFLSDQAPATTREDLVNRLEVGLSQHLIAKGLRLDALITPPESFTGNITIHEWERLIRGFFHKSVYPLLKLKNLTEHKDLYPELCIDRMRQVITEELALPGISANELLSDLP